MSPPPCQLCKSRCAKSLATGTLFGIYFQPSFVPAVIVPCNVRLEFNELTEDTVIFEAPGGSYPMELEKGPKMTQMGRDGWDRFLDHFRLTGGELISFSLRGRRPKVSVIYLNTDDDDVDPFDDVVFAQRMRLNDDETGNLFDKLPSRDDYVGVPFVTRLTRTNGTDRHVMKLPKRLALSCGIEANEAGYAGVRLTARGSVSTCAYVADTDGRIVLSAVGWKNFLIGKNLQVGQAIIVTIRNTRRHDLRMMIVIDIIY